MKVEKVPVEFRYGRKTYNIEGHKFKPSAEVMYRFSVDIAKKKEPVIIVLYQSKKPNEKFNWDFESEESNHLSKLISKALEKQLLA